MENFEENYEMNEPEKEETKENKKTSVFDKFKSVFSKKGKEENLTSSQTETDDVATEFAVVGENAKKAITLDKQAKIMPLIVFAIGALLMLLEWIIGLNIVSLVCAVYMIAVSVIIMVALIWKKKVYLWYLLGYMCVSFGVFSFYVVAGADAGFGAFVDCVPGFASSAHQFWQGAGNFGTRLLGNFLMCSPAFLLIVGLFVLVACWKKQGNVAVKNGIAYTLATCLILMSVIFVFIMNLRANPRVFNMQKGHDEYLKNVKKNAKEGSPNVLFVLMDDMGYGDSSFNANKAGITPSFQTPNIDSIAENGADFENFYTNYSVCSPSRFSAMTGRYPYRGYADNVMYPTVNSIAPFAKSRVLNSVEMGANCDGMLGDEVTMAEAFKAAGYNTGAFGKWHLGDYGQYLPTNQGFDYFYGSHHINDNSPYYHVREGGELGQGNYQIEVGADIDQSNNSELIHNEINNWVTAQADKDTPFFAYYASPWPHGPVHAGYDFQGKSGAGIYGDCLMEFDYYLGKLFDTMKEKGIFDDTIIVFTSDNGPALQGSANELRGGKYTPYEAGQKVPFYMQWNNAPSEYANLQNNSEQNTVTASANMADLFPTFAKMCNITNTNESITGYMPSDVDRDIDGVDMTPLLKDTTNSVFVHDINHPILHMKREQIKAIQYNMTKEQVLDSVKGYTQGTNHSLQTGNEADYANLPFIKNNNYLNWKYIRKYGNDNPAFFNMSRKKWLICLTDDTSESYQRAGMFPTIAEQMDKTMTDWTKKFKDNRRGIYKNYYKK